MWRYIIGGLIVLIAFVTCGGGGGMDPQDLFSIDCKNVIESRLKAPATAKFSQSYERVEQTGSTYRWTGYVDSENSFGANVRTAFVCTGVPERVNVNLF